MLTILLIGGILSYTGLGRLEFPAFPIPQALVMTSYQGASPEQVEEEVTLPIEKAILELEYVKHVDSVSTSGLSQITVELADKYKADDQPQIWDELRRKVNDVQAELPPGVFDSQVFDDFSDVYGMLLNISGDDFSYRELENYADYLQRELLSIKGVKKVSIAGNIAEQIVIEFSQQNLNTLGIDLNWIVSLIQNKNVVSNAGNIINQGQSIRIHPTGEIQDVHELEYLVISLPGSSKIIRLGDVASVKREMEETPTTLYRSNGSRALSLGVSFANGINVVNVGLAVDAKLQELESSRPIGIDLTRVYDQPAEVDASVSNFLVSLVQSIVIVIVVLLIAMDVRSGILMGGILLLTILATFLGMRIVDIEIQAISLGALIIALGMLVDNAIVITEGVMINLKKGMSKKKSINQVVSQNQWPLLGATIIAILAFAPIGLSPDSTGDFLKSLFLVLMISLLISWVIALTITPFFCELMFKEEIQNGMDAQKEDPYQGVVFNLYRGLLHTSLKYRKTVISLVLVLLVLSVVAFGYVRQSFFPPSNTPIFYVDIWMQQGTDIRETKKRVEDIEKLALQNKDVQNLTTVIGSGAQRFVLTYAPEKIYSSYAQLIVEADSLETIEKIIPTMKKDFESAFPDIEFKFKLMDLGPSPAAKVEARFYGPDPVVLRSLAAKATSVFEEEPIAAAVRHSWREKTNVIRPRIDEAAARRSGVSKQALDEALLVKFSGKQVGVYRDGSHFLPIVMRAPDDERLSTDRISDLQVWSEENKTFVPVQQITNGLEIESENSLIIRRDYRRVIAVLADVSPFGDATPESLRLKVKDKIEAIPLPDGYNFEWGGEHEAEVAAMDSLNTFLPIGFLSMFLITLVLFNSVRQPLAIWFTVPLIIIGVSVGLLALNVPFSFTALLGLLSLSGMVVKNGIVLTEQINIEMEEGMSTFDAIISASISRSRPVCMAALTTMLGMIPLIFDAFFQSMAVSIIFGLGFATVLTLVVLPVVYAVLYRVKCQ